MLKNYFFACCGILFYIVLFVQHSKAGRSRSHANIDVEIAPHWTRAKKMKKRFHGEPAGNTVQFKCIAAGEAPLITKWFKDGEEIVRDQRIGSFKFRHKNQTILLESVVLSDKGMYKCVVSNKFGSINHTYELEVSERPSAKPIIQGGSLKNQTVSIGADATFRCKVFSDTHPHVQWLKINTSNPDDIFIIKKAGVNRTNAEMQTLTLRNVSQQDEGEYVCLAGNSIGISHQSAWLTVGSAPHWTSARKMKPLHAEPAGNTVQIRCLADGDGPVTTKWFKDGKEILRSSRMGSFEFRHNNQIIEIRSVVVSDHGMYKCVVSNRFGSINYTSELDVAERSAHRPILVHGLPANKTARPGDDVEFRCVVYSDTYPYIQWLKKIEINGSKIDPETKSPYVKILKKPGITVSHPEILTLRNVSQQDEGEYVCLAGNSIGISQQSAWLTVGTANDGLLKLSSFLGILKTSVAILENLLSDGF